MGSPKAAQASAAPRRLSSNGQESRSGDSLDRRAGLGSRPPPVGDDLLQRRAGRPQLERRTAVLAPLAVRGSDAVKTPVSFVSSAARPRLRLAQASPPAP